MESLMLGANAIDMTGAVCERLTVLREDGRDNNRNVMWIARCACGNMTRVRTRDLRNRTTKSCGCLNRDTVVRRNEAAATHVHTPMGVPSRTYRSWMSMMTRCFNPKHEAYGRYAGRGIAVCERWKTFANFLADMGERPEDRTLDRIDNDKGYFPGNCRWATRSEQNKNKRPKYSVTPRPIAA